MENYLVVPTDSGPMSVFCSTEEKEKRLPVVIVLQEAFGVNEHIKKICRNLSQKGFFTLAPELYHRSSQHLTIDYTQKEAIYPELEKLSNEDILSDLSAVIKFLPELPIADTENIYLLGFCIGGFASLLGPPNSHSKGAFHSTAQGW